MGEAAPEPDGVRRPDGAGAADPGVPDCRAALEHGLAPALVEAIHIAGGYGGKVYLRSRDRTSLVLTMVAGVPRALLKAWWRVPVGGAVPSAEAYRTERVVSLADEGETMRRFPQMSVGLPYPFASAYLPIRLGGEVVGVLGVLRAASHGRQPDAVDERRFERAASTVDTALRHLEAAGCVIEYDDEPIGVTLPADPATAVRVGLIDWDLGTDIFTADTTGCAVLGLDPSSCGGTIAQVAERVHPEDVRELRAAARDAARTGWVRGRSFRVCEAPREPGEGTGAPTGANGPSAAPGSVDAPTAPRPADDSVA
ncbi:GAF domain-containing protein, partial [Streptomyces sp. URMC 123]|uniref:GAF domain-containing protein n=1 Tax=Streptomyces sp. URMC 123 TaxID=3423403 RepID=UPI003F199BC4